MRRQRYPYSWLLRAATQVLKYFFLGLAGCTVAYFISTVLGLGVLSSLLVALIETVLVRLLVLVLAMMAIAIIAESLRH